MTRLLANVATMAVLFTFLGDVSAQPSLKSHAQRDAQMRAARGVKGHILGAAPGTNIGVGWSTRSAEQAVTIACYWNRPWAREYAVVRGRDGWYASVVYDRNRPRGMNNSGPVAVRSQPQPQPQRRLFRRFFRRR